MEASIAKLESNSNQLSRQASSDAQVIGMWLHGRSAHTQRAYRADVDRLSAFSQRGIQQLTLMDLQAFADSLAGSEAYKARTLSSIKSLLKFAHRLGYTQYDVGAPLRLPKYKTELANRILTEAEVHAIIALESNKRNRVLLQLLYASGGRVSEICGLMWKDCQKRESGGQVTLFGKGGKTRTVLLPTDKWEALISIKGSSVIDMPVFQSRKGRGHLDATQVLRIVRSAAKRAGVEGNVSPHWFRHSHASHALDRGCPVHVVQATLGHSSLTTTTRYVHVRPTESSAKYLA